MGLFERLDDLYQRLFNYHVYSRIFMTVAAVLGAVILLIYTVKLTLILWKDLRLYFFGQLKCCQVNFVEKYGKWALVTGATDGIGQSIAKELAACGMSIIVVARNRDKLAATKAALEAIPNVGDVETIRVDLSVSSIENFKKVKEQIDPEKRDIGILVNNAGTFPDRFRRFNKFDIEDLVSIANLNMLNPIHMTHMIMPGMLARGRGLVLNVSSVLSFMPVPYMSIYGATKTFMNAFTRQLQLEYSSHPVQIVLLTPGPVQTKIFGSATTITNTSLINPTSDQFARTAINGLSLRCNSYCGTFMHEVIYYSCCLAKSFGFLDLVLPLNMKLCAKDFELSPVARSRKKPADSNA